MEGQIQLGSDFILRRVLFVLKFTYNLIWVGWLTDDMKCLVTIFPAFCLLHNLTSNMLIDAGESGGSLSTKSSGIWISLSYCEHSFKNRTEPASSIGNQSLTLFGSHK